ncbi:MOSC and FAD-binding oxidoreductase domain-containing protein [Mycolicibacterium neoaurum]|uniref:MOSC and FAD-binding oxidoreductase domain-containing protein n=1 Tax=Mycolicibacterium neoaurum TaxID=1795 RepID=UPI002673BC21|nr:MOSC and FAD-binding oxidoreductase domain-containing protein [Mycolicibacterium neoaurum]MDO3400855.1 MOSC and FAD-binding oxidoreductase domain-containing protein [Mycolicibacterium neoaurum]
MMADAAGDPRLVSINIGMPQDVPWQGRVVRTAVYKTPVSGPVMVRRLNIDGDGQGDLGGHGGEQRAVLVYQLGSYEHWSAVLGRDDLRPGHFGENFTVSGLGDDEVCIGDRFRVGAVVLEVTQPRVTCYRVGLRLGEPRMAALLVADHRPGFYCRVIEEGEVRPGEVITKIATGPEQVSVAEIDALLYLPGHSPELLARALKIPALSPGWQQSLRALAEQDGEQQPGSSGNPGLTAAAGAPPAWAGFRRLAVRTLERAGADIVVLTLVDRDGGPLPGWRPGQYVTVRLTPEDGPAVIRSYSLSNLPGSPEFRVAVKRLAGGAAGEYLHTRVGVGDAVDVAAPRGAFTLDDGADPVVLLSAGIGVTPLLSMLHLLADHRSTREVWWIHGSRDGAEHAFAEEIRALIGRLPHAHSRTFYSRPGPADRLGLDYDHAGRISVDTLRGLGVPLEGDIYGCGPTGFMNDLVTGLENLGIGTGRLHTETFGAAAAVNPGLAGVVVPAGVHPPAETGSGPAVSFARSSLTVAWSAHYGSLLEFAEACDVPTRWSCRTGVCHTCETGLLAGEVGYDPEPLEPPAAGNLLPCCAYPSGDVVLDM